MSSSNVLSDRDRVLAATDILSVIGEVIALRPKGREHVGLCPFHEDRTPSMAVVTHKAAFGGSGFYKCFACGAAGNAIDFVMNYHRMEFVDALKFLAAKAGVELTPFQPSRPRRDGEPTRDEVLRANAMAEKFFRRVFADEDRGARARAEVERRGFGPDIVEGFGIGAAPARSDALVEGVQKAIRSGGADYPPFEAFVQAGVIRPARSGGGHIDLLRDRLVFPICDELGRPIAFGGRKLDPEQEPKYLNSPESPVFHKSRALYGIHRAKRAIVERKQAIVTEGYTDVIACHRAGFTNAVATLGTALTREHARVLRRMADSVVLLFDGDEAGQKAADRALEVFFSESIDIKICVLPDNLDPDDLLRSEGGAERFAEALRRSSDALPFMASRIRRQFDGRGLSARQVAIETTLAKFVDLGLNAMNGLRRQLVLQTLSELFGISPQDLDRVARSLAPRGVSGGAPEGVTQGPAATIIEPLRSLPGNAARARARMLAERRLLALLCLEPAAAHVAVDVVGAGSLPLSEALAPEEFIDPAHSAMFAVIRDAAEAGRTLFFDALLGEIADPAIKRLASDLYILGQEVLRAAAIQAGLGGQERSVAEELIVSWNDLESLTRREKFRAVEKPGRSGDSFEEPHTRPASVAREPASHEDLARESLAPEALDRESFAEGDQSHSQAPASTGKSARPSADQGARETVGASPKAIDSDGSFGEESQELRDAVERLARLRERGHDVTAVSALFRRRPNAGASDPRRSNNP